MRSIWHKLLRMASRRYAQGLVEYALILVFMALVVMLARMGNVAAVPTETLGNVSKELAENRA